MKRNPNCKTQLAIAWLKEKPSRTVSMAALKFNVYRSGIHTALQRHEIDKLKSEVAMLNVVIKRYEKCVLIAPECA